MLCLLVSLVVCDVFKYLIKDSRWMNLWMEDMMVGEGEMDR